MGARFSSILYPADAEDRPPETTPPACFRDLGLDQIVEAIVAGRDEYDLSVFFYTPLHDVRAVAYRQEVMRDLEAPAVTGAISAFAEGMREMRECRRRATASRYAPEQQRWHLAAAETYVDAVERLEQELRSLAPASQGLASFGVYLTELVQGAAFRTVADGARALAAELGKVRYGLLLRDGAVTVRFHDGAPDYSAIIEESFRKFRQGTVKDYRKKVNAPSEMNHVDALIAERVALLFPETFAALAGFCRDHADFVDPVVARFDREVQFYIATLEHVARFRRAGLAFCYPELSDRDKAVAASAAVDLALAARLLGEKTAVVANDFHLEGPERALVVTGPNQGGKTTFARLFGQLHYLASLGCPVAARKARLFLADQIFTHFERQEAIADLRGKLEDDLQRIRLILERATPRSIVILNEIFSSTTLDDALYLGREVLGRLLRLDVLCVCVTFLDELSNLGAQTVSMVAGVDPADRLQRTYKVERRPADGLAYALAIAEKHGVTYFRLKERIRP